MKPIIPGSGSEMFFFFVFFSIFRAPPGFSLSVSNRFRLVSRIFLNSVHYKHIGARMFQCVQGWMVPRCGARKERRETEWRIFISLLRNHCLKNALTLIFFSHIINYWNSQQSIFTSRYVPMCFYRCYSLGLSGRLSPNDDVKSWIKCRH